MKTQPTLTFPTQAPSRMPSILTPKPVASFFPSPVKRKAKDKAEVVKPTFRYPDDHPFAIFEGNYQQVIDWHIVGLKRKASTEEELVKNTPEERVRKVLAHKFAFVPQGTVVKDGA